MSMMDTDTSLQTNSSTIEEVVLELEWAVHEAARKRIDGQPADQELADIDRLVSVQVCLAAQDSELRSIAA